MRTPDVYELTVARVQSVLEDSDRRPRYRGHPNLLVGQCYVASEVVKAIHPELRPHVMTVQGGTHWFLVAPDGTVVDPTAGQFSFTPAYHEGRGCGFLTSGPSARARAILNRLEESEGN